jgi:hypothetical protein
MPRTQRHTRIIPSGNKSLRRAFRYIIFSLAFSFFLCCCVSSVFKFIHHGELFTLAASTCDFHFLAQGMLLSEKARVNSECIYKTKYSSEFFRPLVAADRKKAH